MATVEHKRTNGEAELPKLHVLSPTQLDCFCRCPEQYRRRYIEREKIPPGIAMLKGTGLHGGAKVNFRQKIESHVDLPASEIIEAAIAAFETETAGGVSFDDDEAGRGAAAVMGEAKDDVADMAALHAKEQAPDYQPVFVEERIKIALPNNAQLLGIVDLGDDKNRLTDFKTSKRSKNKDEADNSVQLTCYSAAYKALTGHDASEVRLDVIVKTKTQTKRQLISSTRDDGDLRALSARIGAVLAGIRAGNFPPAVPGAWWCSPKWCGYWKTCPYVNSERKELSDGNDR